LLPLARHRHDRRDKPGHMVHAANNKRGGNDR
jgi:hypothetical protein